MLMLQRPLGKAFGGIMDVGVCMRKTDYEVGAALSLSLSAMVIAVTPLFFFSLSFSLLMPINVYFSTSFFFYLLQGFAFYSRGQLTLL